jgi:hypothetical protein
MDTALSQKAVVAAENAYGASVHKSLKDAVELVQTDVSYLERCVTVMGIQETERLKSGLTLLAKRFDS